MNEKLTVEELIKALHLCAEKTKNGETCITGQKDCPFGVTVMDFTERMNLAAADSLESIAAERDAYRDKLKAALAENTRLTEKVAVKSEQLENLRTIFYEVTGSVPSKASQPVPLPEPPKEEKAMKTVIAEKDGNAFVAHYDDFINLQESPAGYGDTPEEAKEMLYAESEGGKQ